MCRRLPSGAGDIRQKPRKRHFLRTFSEKLEEDFREVPEEDNYPAGELWSELYERFPIVRPGRVDEVAHVVAFLVSDLAS